MTFDKVVLDSRQEDVVVANARLRVERLVHDREHREAGPVLVFLHEALGCIELWRNFPRALATATGLDALVYDRQGHGRSGRLSSTRGLDYLHREASETLPLLLSMLEVRRCVLVGHSDGGSIALLYASRFPDSTAGVITEAAHVFVEDVTLEGIRQAVRTYAATDLRHRLAKYHGAKSDEIFGAWADTWLSPEFSGWNIEPELSRITCPCLVIQGVDDEYGTVAQVRGIVEHSGSLARPLLLEDCGHSPHLDQADLVLREMADFIVGLGSGLRK